MRLFDELRCEIPLPGIGANQGDFQTKDFQCSLEVHFIKEDGLYLIPELGCTADHEPILAADFTGEVNFYGAQRGSRNAIDYRYDLRYVEGKHTAVRVLSLRDKEVTGSYVRGETEYWVKIAEGGLVWD